jgi:hypothetical protein
MNYSLLTPCDECPFLNNANMRAAFTLKRLRDFVGGEFPCHKTAKLDEESDEFYATPRSVHCAGALIFMKKRRIPHQMMRIVQHLGMFDPDTLDESRKVR